MPFPDPAIRVSIAGRWQQPFCCQSPAKNNSWAVTHSTPTANLQLAWKRWEFPNLPHWKFRVKPRVCRSCRARERDKAGEQRTEKIGKARGVWMTVKDWTLGIVLLTQLGGCGNSENQAAHSTGPGGMGAGDVNGYAGSATTAGAGAAASAQTGGVTDATAGAAAGGRAGTSAGIDTSAGAGGAMVRTAAAWTLAPSTIRAPL